MTTRARLLVLLVTASLGTSGLLAVPTAGFNVYGPEVTVDLSLGNEIATGAVSDADPAHARVTVSNRYHFWAGLDLQAPTGGAQLSPTAIGEDVRGIYGLLGLIGPESTSAWAGTFDPAGSSQAVWVHYDLATARGAQAFALTSLTIIADTAGAPLLAKSPAMVVQAITLLTDLDEFTNLVSGFQRSDPNIWEITKAWTALFESRVARDTMRLALANMGVIVTDGFMKSLGTLAGAIDFLQTMRDLVLAGIGSHTSGVVTFGVVGVATGGAPTPSRSPGSTSVPTPRPTLKSGASSAPQPPDPPSFISPQDASSITGASGAMCWTVSTDPNGEAVHYRIAYYADPNDGATPTSNGMFFIDTGSATCQSIAPIAQLVADHGWGHARIIWHVDAIDATGTESNQSTCWNRASTGWVDCHGNPYWTYFTLYP